MLRCPEISIEEVTTDPMIRAVMRADGVDPAAFEALLHALASSRRASGSETPKRVALAWNPSQA